MQPNKMFPANLLKFNAYIKVVDSLEAAIDVIKKKRLAYGEPCVVTYKTSPSAESSDGIFKKVVFGIGSMDPSEPYFFNVEYGKDGKPIEQTELLKEMAEIIKEWEKHGGFTTTAIKFSKTEPSNINDVEFSFGDIILGEASVKHVLDSVDKSSADLVTSKGIYTFVNGLISSIETTVNNLNTKVNRVTKDVSTLNADVSTLKSEVSVIKVNQNKLISDVSVLKMHDTSTITGNNGTNTEHNIDGGSWTRAELDNAKIVVYVQRGNNTTQASFSFWGATLSVSYTIPEDEYYTYTLTNVSADHTIIIGDSIIDIPDEDPNYNYYPITISSINATTEPGRGRYG